MTLIPITGMTEDSLTNASIEPTGGGFRPFPCDASGWTRHTGHVLKAEIKTINDEDFLSIYIVNVQHGGEVLLNLDPSKVGPGAADPAKTRQQNLENLVRAIKILGAHTGGKLDTKKLENSRNQIVEVLAKHKGFREKDGKVYHKVSLILSGTAPAEVDVVHVAMPIPPNPVAAPSLPASSAPAGYGEPDPFFS